MFDRIKRIFKTKPVFAPKPTIAEPVVETPEPPKPERLLSELFKTNETMAFVPMPEIPFLGLPAGEVLKIVGAEERDLPNSAIVMHNLEVGNSFFQSSGEYLVCIIGIPRPGSRVAGSLVQLTPEHARSLGEHLIEVANDLEERNRVEGLLRKPKE